MVILAIQLPWDKLASLVIAMVGLAIVELASAFHARAILKVKGIKYYDGVINNS